MGESEALPINHHADHKGFSGVTGTLVGLILMLMGRAKARLAADLTGVSADDSVVDIGCGPGTAAREAARRGAQVTGVDPSPELLRLARTFSRGQSITWVEGTAENVPLPDESATVVWALATVHHWQDVDRGIGEAHRLLRSNGRLLAMERHSPPGATGLASHGWTRQQAEAFAAHCRTAGFGDVTVDRHGDGRRASWAVSAVRS